MELSHSEALWVRKFVYQCMQEILVLTKSSVPPPLHVSGCEIAYSSRHILSMFKCGTIQWTSMLWSIESCPKRVSADQCHMRYTTQWDHVFFIAEFTLLSKCKSWITWERHFSLNDTTRALLWAFVKCILYHYYISNWFWKCIMLVCVEQTSMPALEDQLANSDFKNRNDCFAVQKSHKFVGNMLHIQ